MKLTKKRNYNGTVREVWNDDKTKYYGVVGTAIDLIKERILTYTDYSPETWFFITKEKYKQSKIGKTKESVLKGIE